MAVNLREAGHPVTGFDLGPVAPVGALRARRGDVGEVRP